MLKWYHNLETVFFQFCFSGNHLGREVNLSACFNVVLVLLIRLPQVCRALKSYKVEQRLKVKALLGGPEHQNILHLLSSHTSSNSLLICGPFLGNDAPQKIVFGQICTEPLRLANPCEYNVLSRAVSYNLKQQYQSIDRVNQKFEVRLNWPKMVKNKVADLLLGQVGP